jgi:putative flippase GtrA
MKLHERRGVRQFVKFAIVGVSSTIIDWGIFYLLNYYFGIYYLIAKGLSFAVSVINSYIWNRRWTFRSANPKKLHEFGKFMLVAVVGLVLNTYIMFLAVEKLHLRYIFGLIFATAIVMFWNFLINKFWTFKEYAI